MSVCSNKSMMSVSYCGTEMDLETALDECFRGLQENLNGAHSAVRSLAMMPEQDNDYSEMLKQTLQIHDLIDDMNSLFKELKLVTSQVIGSPHKDEKVAMKKIVDDHKAARKKEKDDIKVAEKMAKQLAASSISHN